MYHLVEHAKNMKIETIKEFKKTLVEYYQDEIALRWVMDLRGLLWNGYRIMKLQQDNPEFWEIVKHDNLALIRKAYRELPKPSKETIKKVLDFAHKNKKERT